MKKPRKPRVKKEIQETAPKLDYAGPVILGIDPAFKKCGFGLIGLEKGEYVHSFQSEMRPYEKKLT